MNQSTPVNIPFEYQDADFNVDVGHHISNTWIVRL